ncbi:MAG: hypothetical protein PHT07_07815 [Paludibacter sp.]|nr:hypothetical protein [Paludibacter sp.]
MKRDAIIIMLFSLGFTILAALSYFSNRNQFILNKFVLATIRSFHFNSTPVISISMIALSECLLWETQNNSSLLTMKTKLNVLLAKYVSVIQLDLRNVTTRNSLIIKELILNSLFLNFRELKLK